MNAEGIDLKLKEIQEWLDKFADSVVSQDLARAKRIKEMIFKVAIFRQDLVGLLKKQSKPKESFDEIYRDTNKW